MDIVSKGGNYLLNVGPTAEGEIPKESIERLHQIGEWMKVNGESIYGTTASPFAKLTWGRCTKKITSDGGTLYFHVFDWPADGKLTIPGLRSKVTSARLLATNKTVDCAVSDDGVTVTLPGEAPDKIASVIEVGFSGPLDVVRLLPKPGADGSIQLGAEWADIHNEIRSVAELKGRGDAARIVNWNKPETRVSWDFDAVPGRYEIMATIGAGSGKLLVKFDKKFGSAEVPASESADERTLSLGFIKIGDAGVSTLELKPKRDGWKGFDLIRLTLKPAP